MVVVGILQSSGQVHFVSQLSQIPLPHLEHTPEGAPAKGTRLHFLSKYPEYAIVLRPSQHFVGIWFLYSGEIAPGIVPPSFTHPTSTQTEFSHLICEGQSRLVLQGIFEHGGHPVGQDPQAAPGGHGGQHCIVVVVVEGSEQGLAQSTQPFSSGICLPGQGSQKHSLSGHFGIVVVGGHGLQFQKPFSQKHAFEPSEQIIIGLVPAHLESFLLEVSADITNVAVNRNKINDRTS